MKIVQIRSFFWSVFSVFSPNAGKYGPEKTPYLDNFHAVQITATSQFILKRNTKLKNFLTFFLALSFPAYLGELKNYPNR